MLPKPYRYAFLAAALALYAALSLYQINLPGLHYDEAFEAVPALQLLTGRPVTAFRNSGLAINGRLFPWMTQDYIGALNTYAAIPFIALLGPTPAALRVMCVLFGLATVWLAFALTRALTTSDRAGLAAALLLAMNPTFIFWSRQGIFVTSITAPIGLAAALCWLRRLQTGKLRWSIAGAFLFGLGLYAKLLFVWLIAALAGAALLLNLSRLTGWQSLFRRVTLREILAAGAALLLGCAPLLAYNVQTAGTLLNITANAQTSYYGVNNLAFGPNLLERLRQFGVFLNGSHLWYLGEVITNNLFPAVLGGVLVGIVILATRSRRPAAAPNPAAVRAALFPFLVMGLVVLFSIQTVSALWVTHFALLMPWPAVALAAGLWYIRAAARPAPAARLVAWTAVTLVVVSGFWSVARYHRALSRSGGLSTHSDAIYDLSNWLDTHSRGGQVVAMDWGLAAPVTYLTGGRVAPLEIFGYGWAPTPDLPVQLEQFIHRPDTLYLWRSPDEIIFDRSGEFKALYRPLNLEEDIEAAFYERSGRPVLGVTRLVKKGTAQNPPR